MTLRVTIEIIPFGVEEDARVIDVINISNVGRKMDPTFHRYLVEHNCYKTGKGLNIVHRREDGALALAALALDEIVISQDEDGTVPS